MIKKLISSILLLLLASSVSAVTLNLKNAELLQYRWEESSAGPPRKYYSLTDKGGVFLIELDSTWKDLAKAVRLTTKIKNDE